MRCLPLCAALAVALLLSVPHSHAGDAETVLIVVECSPDEVARVKAALAELPVTIYVAERPDSDGGLPERTPAPPRAPLRSALPVVTALYEALSGIPPEELGEFLLIQKVEVTERELSFSVIASSTAALDRIRAAVSASALIQARARRGGVEAGSVRRHGGRLQTSFEVAFAPGDGPDSARREALEPLSLDRLHASATKAGIAIRAISAERRDVRGSVTHVTREVQLEDSTLDVLLAWTHAIDSAPDLSVVAMRWQLADPGPKEQDPPGQRIRPARVTIGYAFSPASPERAADR